MSRPPRRPAALALVATLVLAAFVPPLVNANRLRGRIVAVAEASLGRKVTIGSVKVRLLPRPGFTLNDFSVQEDPAFGMEPFLRADQVTADLRLASLWKGRLEIARLELKDPSVNLVRDAAGRWNLETLLARASSVPAAPTARRTAEARPRFPYISADSGRINYKLQQAKQPHALVETDFSLWLESEGHWRMRLEGRPVRTDANLGDTGTLSAEADFYPASQIRGSRFEGHLELRRGQLGQLSHLVFGRDRGWRGAVDLHIIGKGTAERLHWNMQGEVAGFRRYDIDALTPIDWKLDCEGDASLPSVAPPYLDAACKAPAGSGAVRMQLHAGQQPQQAPSHSTSLELAAENVPADFLAQLARVAKRYLPDDFTAEGTLNAAFHFVRDSGIWRLDGGTARFNSIVVRSNALHSRMTLGDFTLAAPPPPAPEKTKRRRAKTSPPPSAAPAPQLASQPLALRAEFPIRINDSAPLHANADFGNGALSFALRGQTTLTDLLGAAQLFGVKDPLIHARGRADIDLALTGVWSGFSQPLVTGTAELSDVTAEVPGVASPLLITTAHFNADAAAYRLQSIRAQLGTMELSGSVDAPRACEGAAPCVARFQLAFPAVDADLLNAELNPRFRPQGWFDRMRTLFGRSDLPQTLGNLQAAGEVTIGRFTARRLLANDLRAGFTLSAGHLETQSLTASVAGGTFKGKAVLDLASNENTVAVQGSLTKAAVAQLAEMTRGNWGTGAINGDVALKLHGSDVASLSRSAQGRATFSWQNGTLRYASADSRPQSFDFKSATGTADFASGALTLSNGELTTRAGKLTFRGVAALDGTIDITLEGPAAARGAFPARISGSVKRSPATEPARSQ